MIYRFLLLSFRGVKLSPFSQTSPQQCRLCSVHLLEIEYGSSLSPFPFQFENVQCCRSFINCSFCSAVKECHIRNLEYEQALMSSSYDFSTGTIAEGKLFVCVCKCRLSQTCTDCHHCRTKWIEINTWNKISTEPVCSPSVQWPRPSICSYCRHSSC